MKTVIDLTHNLSTQYFIYAILYLRNTFGYKLPIFINPTFECLLARPTTLHIIAL